MISTLVSIISQYGKNKKQTKKKTSRLQDNKVKVVPIFHVFEQFTRTRKSHGTDAARFFWSRKSSPHACHRFTFVHVPPRNMALFEFVFSLTEVPP